jgi:hypothetical protein
VTLPEVLLERAKLPTARLETRDGRLPLTNVVKTFPSVVIHNSPGKLPIEVSLIAQLGHGAGTHLNHSVAARQRAHGEYVDALDEPSAKIAGTHVGLGDPAALYSFIVGPQGHPFHRHAGNRIFTAVSGSGGAQLRFSTATDGDILENPRRFVAAMRLVNIPPDCLFTVRFGGGTWHQFAPLAENSVHPVLFALSCHTNELGGDLPDDLKAQVLAGGADIPTLTELLPDQVTELLRSDLLQSGMIPTTTLALDAPAGTIHREVCNGVRGGMGRARGLWSSRYPAGGYVSRTGSDMRVMELREPSEGSLLGLSSDEEPADHSDTFLLTLEGPWLGQWTTAQLLEFFLEGFLTNSPKGVARLMAFRNLLVRPLGLRTSPLGCPVSSLLARDSAMALFANRFPVLDQAASADGNRAQVLLGANDKHLRFRSCVGVERLSPTQVALTMGTRVRCLNWFGHFYMGAISFVHRRYISPRMIVAATMHLLTLAECPSTADCKS